MAATAASLRLYSVLAAVCACVVGLGVGAVQAQGQVSFSGPTDFTAGSLPASVAVGDFNGDTRPDLAVANQNSDNVSVLLGNGAGGFLAATNFPAGDEATSVALGDFNRDTKQDLAVANTGSNNVSSLLGNGSGGFSSPTNFGAGAGSFSVAVGEFNGDAKQDLAVANQGSDNVSILLGNGSGGFSSPTNFGAGDAPFSVAVGDFNGDAKQDLIVANQGSDNVSILLGNGSGGFAAPTNFAAGGGAVSVAVGSFNGDAKPDLAVATVNPQTVSILLGNGSGGFSAPTSFLAGASPRSVAVGDIDGDAKQDLAVVSNILSGNVSILLGNGSGGFSTPTNFSAGASPQSVAVGNFNGDVRPDLAVANGSSGNVSILLNTTGAPPSYRAVVLGDSPRGYWRLGEAAGTVAADTAGSNPGTYLGGFTLGRPGILSDNSAVQLNGSTGYVSVPDSPSLHTGDHFSLELWLKRIKLSTSVQVEGLFLKGYQLYLTPPGRLVLRKPLVRQIASSNVAITDTTQFHHVVATKSGAAVKLYVDGVDATSAVSNLTIVDTSGRLAIGAGANTFRGILDEAAVYNYALSAAQVANHFNAGN